MDLAKAIAKLREEREQLDKVIASLEQLQATAVDAGTLGIKKRRGRKFMDEKGRKEVSERMKRYWASRKKLQATG